MSKFLLLHDNESKGKPAAVRLDIISSVMPSDEYPKGSSVYILTNTGECAVIEAEESVEKICSILNK